MITNEERREIAAKLRNFENDDVGSYSEFCEKLDEIIRVPYPYQTTQQRLADLIEPEPEQTYQIDTSKYKNGGTVSCGACGKRIPTKSRNTETVEAKYPRCPWCGVKVVNKHD